MIKEIGNASPFQVNLFPDRKKMLTPFIKATEQPLLPHVVPYTSLHRYICKEKEGLRAMSVHFWVCISIVNYIQEVIVCSISFNISLLPLDIELVSLVKV